MRRREVIAGLAFACECAWPHDPADPPGASRRGDRVRRREFLASLAVPTAAVGCPSVATPQTANIPRIGMMQGGHPTVGGSLVEFFKERLRELGYVEGSDYALEVRWAEGRLERMPEFAVELVRLNPRSIARRQSQPKRRPAPPQSLC